MVSLANVSPISATAKAGGSMNQVVPKYVLMGLKIMLLSLGLLLHSKCEISSIFLLSFRFLLGGRMKRKVYLFPWCFQSLLQTQTL